MRYRKSRRFRHRSNGRIHSNNGSKPSGLRSGHFPMERSRNGFRNYQNAEKLVEKYNALAKEALSSGDKILSENYLQHADHFTRIVDEKALVKSQSQNNTVTSNDEISKNSELETSNVSSQDKLLETPKENK